MSRCDEVLKHFGLDEERCCCWACHQYGLAPVPAVTIDEAFGRFVSINNEES